MLESIQKSQKNLSPKEFLFKVLETLNFLRSKWLLLTLVSFIGGVIGLIYALKSPITYTAKLTFILEEGKSNASGLGGLASLAGQFGVDVGSGGGEGVLSSDNILLYFKSPTLAKEVLLSQFDNKEQISLADKYVEVYDLKNQWKKDKKIGNINFKPMNKNIVYSRIQDSLLKVISDKVISENFDVTRPDKKAGFIDVSVEMENEDLAKFYCERLVQRVVERYINLKIKRQKATVEKLQARVDSVAGLLKQKTYSGAALQSKTSLMDINPLYRTNSAVDVESTLRDKTLLATIFASVTQNLEIAKFTLSQETPVIQIIDEPIYPLKINKVSKFQMTVLFSIITLFLCVFYLFSKRFINEILK